MTYQTQTKTMNKGAPKSIGGTVVTLHGYSAVDGTFVPINVSPSGGITSTLGSKQVAAKGTLGAELDVTPTDNLTIYEMIINAPLADSDATLKIYIDSVSGPNTIFDGYLANRDGDSAIKFPAGETCTTKFIVAVTGGSGDLFALARYE